MINNFLAPYIQMFYGSAYSIQQSLEGYGVSSSNFLEFDSGGRLVGAYWSPAQAVLTPFMMLTAYVVLCLIPFVLSAGYILCRRWGALLSLFFLMLPGLMNMLGWWPDVTFVPKEFVIGGSGVIGEVAGYLPLLIIGLISGWSITIIIYDSFFLSDKFRNLYDHLWYCSAIVVGISFVADSEANRHKEVLIEENKISSQASDYLARQLSDYHEYCNEEGKVSLISCGWAFDVQQLLVDYTYFDQALYSVLGPKSTLELYFPFSRSGTLEDAMKIRKEIKEFNDLMCPVRQLIGATKLQSKSSTICETVPARFCSSFPEPPEGFVDKHIASQTVAIASECIIPALVRSREIQEALGIKVENESRNQHLRWLYFLVFSLIAGGKIANASTKLFSMDVRPPEERIRLLDLFRRVFRYLFVAGSYMARILSKAKAALKENTLRIKGS